MKIGNQTIFNALKSKNMKRFTALLLSSLMIAAVLLISFHHHDDEQDHPDCSICAVAHHHTSNVFVPPTYVQPIRVALPNNFVQYIPKFHSIALVISQSRAPPA